jgi:hypothetical protein
MKGFNQRGFKHARNLMYAFILGYLEFMHKALLAITCIPHLCSVHQDGDDEGIVNLSLVEKV